MTIFPKTYRVLSNNEFLSGNHKIVPIRYEDRFLIMQWRNEQIYHLRQAKPLTEIDQENYFLDIVSKLFDQEKPGQILFSYLENDTCIGYGGLVHINWIDQNAEISFVMNTRLEENAFHKHWSIYLDLIEQVAFGQLKLHKLFTYAFDLRPHLYEAIEVKGYIKEAELKEHCYFEGRFKSVIIHSKINNNLTLRRANLNDKDIIFEWANDDVTRANSFYTEPIRFEAHAVWYDNKMKDENAVFFIGEINYQPIGLVRFDNRKNEVVIGILIDENFRGKGLASLFLKAACEEYSRTNPATIFAYIKKENSVSVRSFEKAGFVFDTALLVNGTESVRYYLQKNEK